MFLSILLMLFRYKYDEIGAHVNKGKYGAYEEQDVLFYNDSEKKDP